MTADFSQYVNLRYFDVSPTAIYLDAIDYAALVLPEFQPRQGTPEDAILQAVSYISALNIAAINRLPDRIMSGVLGMMGVELDGGDFASIDVLFTAIDYDGTTVPQGTVVRYDYEFLGERKSVYFETIESLIISPVVYTGTEPLPSGVVEARAIDVGVVLPIEDDSALSIDTPTSNILSASVDTMISQGSNSETSSEYLNRAVSYLASLSSSFTRPSQIEGFALSQYSSTVSRCKVFDLTNSDGDLLWADPDEVGYVTVFVYGINEQTTGSQKTDLLAAIQSRTVAGLSIEVLDVNIVELEISFNAAYSDEYDSVTVESNLKTVISSYFSPQNYRFAEGIKESEFYSVISSVPGVVYITGLSLTVVSGGTLSGSDVSFTLKGSLPYINPDNITATLTPLTT